MAYAVENALFQWEEGARRITELPDLERRTLERIVDLVVEELRRRLGSTFVLDELADYYAQDTDWAADIAWRHAAAGDSAPVVDAAFYRYARESSNYAGGRRRPSGAR